MAAKASSAALEAYRRNILSDTVETRIAELAESVARYEANKSDSEQRLKKLMSSTGWAANEASLSRFTEQIRGLAEQTWRDEDELLTAFERAKDAGAKPAVLQEIGLRPDAALTAARGRLKSNRGGRQEPATRGDSATSTPVAAQPQPIQGKAADALA